MREAEYALILSLTILVALVILALVVPAAMVQLGHLWKGI